MLEINVSSNQLIPAKYNKVSYGQKFCLSILSVLDNVADPTSINPKLYPDVRLRWSRNLPPAFLSNIMRLLWSRLDGELNGTKLWRIGML